MATKQIAVINDDGDEEILTLRGEWTICDRCCGEGTHDHLAFSNGISADEWNGPDWDDDSREMYMSGGYDVRCEECDGSGKVIEFAEEMNDERTWRLYTEDERMRRESEAEAASERRFIYGY